MKILIVTYNTKPGMRDEFFNKIHEEKIDTASRAEAGNVRYSYFKSVDNENQLLLLETWKDEEAFKTHCDCDHFKKLQKYKEQYVQNTIIEKLQI